MPARHLQSGRVSLLRSRGFLAVGALAIGAVSCSRPQTVPPGSASPPLRIPVPGPRALPPSIPAPDRFGITPVDWTRSPWTPEQPAREWHYIVLHHTATRAGSVESIHRAHLARKDADGNAWLGIGYHFVIGNGHGMGDGAIEPTFRWQKQIDGAHAGITLYNREGIGICLIGNFEKHAPTEAQLESLKALTRTLCVEFGIPPHNVKGHADVKSTACPGRFFPMQELIRTLNSLALPSSDM